MDQRLGADVPSEPADETIPEVEQASAEYLGRWNCLVSTTNWEKGRIIIQWRQALIDSGAPPQSYSDEAWSRRVGNVSGQHVGRLRRVYDRFGQVYDEYPGLYWSHFQAALDWHDAEMWLEGAVENGWSVAQMRARRWEVTGAPADEKPREEDVITAEMDEDVDPAHDSMPGTIGESVGVVQDPQEADQSRVESDEAGDTVAFDAPDPSAETTTAVEPVRPFEDLAALPDDLNEAFEAFKLAILNHKLSGWREISCGEVLATLDALKQLALAPSDD